MIAEGVGPDTQAVLLLAASLGKSSGDSVKYLAPKEYSSLAEILHKEGLRPSDLLQDSSHALLSPIIAQLSPAMRERVTSERVARLLERGGRLSLAMTRWTNAGLWVLSRADAEYPARYKRILKKGAPPVVFGVGPRDSLERGGLAVVGSRKPETSSFDYTVAVGRWAAQEGVQVVSGAAKGVDETAMLSCADNGGTTVGVVAESLLKLSTRKEYRQSIVARHMTLISSFDPDAAFTVGNAMARNKWIYALADRALVVACSQERGGTWAGATEAIKHGFAVYARVGNPDRPGNEALVRQGALPIKDDFSVLLRQPAMPIVAADQQNANLAKDSNIYEVVGPLLLRKLSAPLTIKELADQVQLVRSQAEAWLQRLLEEGLVRKVKTRYQAVSAEQQPSLFEED